MDVIRNSAFFEKALEALPFPLIIHNEKKQILYANLLAVDLFKAPHHQALLTKNIDELVIRDSKLLTGGRIYCQDFTDHRFIADIQQTQMQFEETNCQQLVFGDIEYNDYSVYPILPSPNLLSRALDTASIAVVMIDNAQKIIFFSQYAEYVFGYQAHEIVGQPLTNLMERNYRDEHPNYVKEFSHAETPWQTMTQREIRCLRKDGSLFVAEIGISHIHQENQEYFIAFINDVMPRKQAEKLRDEKFAFIEMLHHTTLDLSSTLNLYEILHRIMIHISNVMPQGSVNIMLLRRNVAWVAHTMDYDEKLSIQWMQDGHLMIDEVSSLSTVVKTKKMLLLNNVQTHEIWMHQEDATWIKSYVGIPIQTTDRVIGIINIYSAETNAFTLEQSNLIQAIANDAVLVILNAQLYASEMKQRILAQIFQEIVYNLRENSSIQYTLNQALQHLTQLIDYYHVATILITQNESLTVAAWHIPDQSENVPASDFQSTYAYPAQTSLYGKVLLGQPLVLDDAYLDENWVDILELDFEVRGWIGVPLVVADIVIGILSINSRYPYAYNIDDISSVISFSQEVSLAIENTRIYHELEISLNDLRTTQNHLYRLMRLATASEIIRSLTHQINNPLLVIIAHVHLLMKRIEPDTPMYRSCELIRSATERVDTTIANLRDFANPSSYNLTMVNINQSIELAVDLLRHQIMKIAVVDLNLAEDLPSIAVSETQLEDVWINLLINAKEAVVNRTNPRIVIETSFNAHQNQIEIIFTDNGEGMSPENLEKIFTPLFTTKQYKTGLGLSLCQDIIARHDGQIHVSSIINKGSTFKIVLPVVK